jgi:D-alanyl-D-alanine carboxypeptidase (penicillin-binding protein 5/6)
MTMHVILKEIEAGRASYDEIIPITRESDSRNMPDRRATRMWLDQRHIGTLREIMLGLAVPSANDAAIAAALRFAPSMTDFAHVMNREARSMGLSVTRFDESSGLSEHNITTAAEFAFFCRQYIVLHPQALTDFHSVLVFPYPVAANFPAPVLNTNTNHFNNRNTLLRTFPGVDGLKTGYIDESGYNIALTAARNGTRLLAVILGAPARPGGDRERDRDGERLLSWAFEHFQTVRPAVPPPEPLRLWKGKERSVSVQPAEPLAFTAPLGRAASVRHSVEINLPLVAPLPARYPAGWLILTDDAGELHRVQLVTDRAYQQGNIFRRMWDSIRLFLLKKST